MTRKKGWVGRSGLDGLFVWGERGEWVIVRSVRCVTSSRGEAEEEK